MALSGVIRKSWITEVLQHTACSLQQSLPIMKTACLVSYRNVRFDSFAAGYGKVGLEVLVVV